MRPATDYPQPRYGVTDNALARWRERVALYGDATWHDVADAVRAATRVGVVAGDLPPVIVANAGFRYYRHATLTSVFFITEVVSPELERVVTVIDAADARPARVVPRAVMLFDGAGKRGSRRRDKGGRR